MISSAVLLIIHIFIFIQLSAAAVEYQRNETRATAKVILVNTYKFICPYHRRRSTQLNNPRLTDSTYIFALSCKQGACLLLLMHAICLSRVNVTARFFLWLTPSLKFNSSENVITGVTCHIMSPFAHTTFSNGLIIYSLKFQLRKKNTSLFALQQKHFARDLVLKWRQKISRKWPQ